MSNLAELQARRGQIVEALANATAAKESADRAAARAQSNAQFATNQQQRTAYQAQYESARAASAASAAEIVKLSGQLAEVDAQIAELQRQQGSVQSSGQTTAQAQTARDDGASSQSPPANPEVVNADGDVVPARSPTVTNASRFTPDQDSGTNGRIRTAQQTQQTPQYLAEPGPPTRDANQPIAPDGGGAAAPSDDASGGNNAVRARINQIFGNNRVVPQDNVLDQFASYTYNFSLYLMSPADYKKLINTKVKNIAGFQLLMQSGGAPPAGGALRSVDPQEQEQAADGNSTAIVQPSLGRNQFFPLDFYMDDVKIKSMINGKGTNAAHNVSEVQFKIYEPNGISLLGRLFDATQQYVALQGGKGTQSYASQNYLLVLRFYGYDQNGNLIRGGRLGQGNTDANAVIEKFIPFQFKHIKFRIANQIVEYDCQGVVPQNIIGTGPARGVIPYNVELNSQTLRDLLLGNLAFAPGASAAAAGSRTTGTVTDNSGFLGTSEPTSPFQVGA